MNACSSDLVSLNSRLYRHWMLATNLFLCYTCNCPGTSFTLLEETGVFKSYETYNCFFVFVVLIMGVFWSKLFVSLLLVPGLSNLADRCPS